MFTFTFFIKELIELTLDFLVYGFSLFYFHYVYRIVEKFTELTNSPGYRLTVQYANDNAKWLADFSLVCIILVTLSRYII